MRTTTRAALMLASSLAAAHAQSSQPPSVTTSIGFGDIGGKAYGSIDSAFQGYAPPVTGALHLVLGPTAYLVPAAVPAEQPLQHVLAATPVPNPTNLGDVAFTLPASGIENPTTGDVGIAGGTQGLSGVLVPLEASLTGLPLGTELQPLLNVSGALLPHFGVNGGAPKGGVLDATPWLHLGASIGDSQTVTVLGLPVTTQQSGSLVINPGTGPAAVTAATDLASLLAASGKVVGDVQTGNLGAAIPDGVATLADATSLTTALGPLLLDAASQHNPTLPAVKKPILSLTVTLGAGQTLGLPGLGLPTQLNQAVNVTITANAFGAYALGRTLGLLAPQLVADLSQSNPQGTALTVLSQLSQDFATLAQDAARNFPLNGTVVPGIPSSRTGADIQIAVSLANTEAQNLVAGSQSNTQTLGLTLDSNAQGFFDLATVGQPALVDLLVALLSTQGGQETLQIGGDVLAYVDSKL